MIKMPLKWREERGQYYEDRISEAQTQRHSIIANREKFRALYNKEPGGFDAVKPFEGASDIHLPVVLDKVETAVPKVVSAMWRAEPFVSVKRASGKNDLKMAKKIENFTSWAFRNDIPDFYQSFDNFNRNRLIDGTALAKIRWLRKWRRTVETHTLDSVIFDEEGKPIGERSIEELFQEIFGLGDIRNTFYKFKKTGKFYSIDYVEDGRRLSAKAQILDGEKLGEVEIRVHRDIIENDSPVFENVDLEDLVFPTRTRTLQNATWIAHKTWHTLESIQEKKKSGKWQISKKDMDFMEGVKRENDDTTLGEQNKDALVGKTANTGRAQTTKDGKVDPNMVKIWEIYTREFVENSDVLVDVILFVLADKRIVLGAEYHDVVFPHGRRPFISDTYIPIDGRVYGLGMAEILYGINLSLDKTINDVNNGMTIKTTPWFLYSIFGLAENKQLLDGIQPGQGIPVGDVNAVKFPDFAQDPAAMFHASFETLRGYADTLTVSPSAGGSNNYRNAPRTARGTLALMDAAEEKLSSLVEQSQATSWKEMVRQVVALYGRYVGVDKWYYVTGETEARRVSPKELRENFHYEFSGSLTSVNRDVQRTLVERLVMVLMQSDLYRQDPAAERELLRRYAEAFGETGDVEPIIPKLQGEGGQPHPPYQQETEMYGLMAGLPIEVLEIDNHEEHLRYITSFKKSDAFGQVNERGRTLIEVDERDHNTKLQQRLAHQQRAEGMGGGMGISTPGSPAEGFPANSGELSALEGGVA